LLFTYFSENVLTILLIILLLKFCYLIYQDGRKHFSNIFLLTFLLKIMFCYYFRCKASISGRLICITTEVCTAVWIHIPMNITNHICIFIPLSRDLERIWKEEVLISFRDCPAIFLVGLRTAMVNLNECSRSPAWDLNRVSRE
jgi:hypothetical protein